MSEWAVHLFIEPSNMRVAPVSAVAGMRSLRAGRFATPTEWHDRRREALAVSQTTTYAFLDAVHCATNKSEHAVWRCWRMKIAHMGGVDASTYVHIYLCRPSDLGELPACR